MPLENPQFISDLVKTNPANSDNAGQGAAHLRILKDALLKSFPQIAGEVELSHEAINQLPQDIIDTAEEKANQAKLDIAGTDPDNAGNVDNNLTELRGLIDALRTEFDDFLNDYSQRDFVDEALQKAFPVGSPFISFTNATNPKDLLGFGTWVAEAKGRLLLGAGSGTDSRGETLSFTAGATGGAYKHKLIKDELPAVKLKIEGKVFVPESFGGYDSGPGHVPRTVYTEAMGKDVPHNITQPYLVAYIWRRTA